MRSCELNLIKYLLFGFNLIFAISGIGLILAGSLVLADVNEFGHFMEDRILAPPIVLIVAGCIVFIIASLGCYGAIRESYHMLMGFAVCLLIILIIELAVGIAAAIFKNDFQQVMKDLMSSSMERYGDKQSDRTAWYNLQTKLGCCGVNGPDDWPKDNRPLACCHPPKEGMAFPERFHCNSAKIGDEILYGDGCFEKLQMKVEGAANILIGVGIGIAFVEVLGIVLACWLASAIKQKK